MATPGPSTSSRPILFGGRSIADSISSANTVGRNDESFAKFQYLPEVALLNVLDKLTVEDLKACRLTCKHWDSMILISELLDMRSCFVFDGRKDDNVGGKCSLYMQESPTKNYYWSHLKFRRVTNRQTPWLFDHLEHDADFTFTISKLELINCSINWLTILQIMMYLPNMDVFIDRQDMYCWDYQTFNSGIEENEPITENPNFLQIRNREKLENLRRLRVAIIHRNQLVECTTYLKLLKLHCDNLTELEITTDQNFAPQRAALFYTHLFILLNRNSRSLKFLRFPYKLVCPTYDFRVTDEHHCFREFLNYITEQRWYETLRLQSLEEISLQFGTIPVDNQDLRSKLVPFITSVQSLKRLSLQCILLESGMERFVEEFLREIHPCRFKTQFGVYMNDAAGVPNILTFQSNLKSLSIQSFRETAKQLKDLIPMFGLESYEDLWELQYFAKNHTFRNFNLDLLMNSFPNLTHLNLVDHNSRLETRHNCEAVATIEDAEMQLIITHLRKLVSLQMIANLTYLTDTGLTGIDRQACKRMYAEGQFSLKELEDKSNVVTGLPLSKLENLRYLVFRGLGIKVTDITALNAFNGMPYLKKLHFYGCHQISPASRAVLSQKFNVSRGCDLQI